MTIIWWDVFLIQVPILGHRVPCPIRVAGDLTDVIPVILGPSVIHHIVWNWFGWLRCDNRDAAKLLIELDPPNILPRG
jgi:hypothetical protein